MTLLARNALRIFGLMSATLAVAQTAWGSGAIDPAFGGSGGPQYLPAESYVSTVTSLPDGRLAVTSASGGGDCCAAIASVQWLDASGRELLRRTELPRSVSPHPIASAARRDGGLLVAGLAETGGGFIIAFTADGSLDTAFGVDGVLTTSRAVTSVAVGPDGRVLYGDTEGLRRIGMLGEGPAAGFVCSCTVWGIWPEADGRVVHGAGEKLLRLNADDTPDPTFGPDGSASVPSPNRQTVRRADGGFYVATALPSAVRVVSYDRDGRPVPGFGFGPGTGVLETRLSTTSLGNANVGDVLRDWAAIATDGSRLYVTVAGVDYLSDYPIPIGQFVARLLPSGRFDESFGHGGLLHLSGYSFAGERAGAIDGLGNGTGIIALVPQSGGRLVVATSSRLFRLTGGDERSPGAIDSALETSQADERGLIRLRLSRFGGSDLPASVRYETQDRSATAGMDYLAASGIIKWDAGSTEEKFIEITVLEDAIDEPNEEFAIVLSAGDGTPLVFRTLHLVVIGDDDPSPSPPAPPAPPPQSPPASGSSGSGGGGAGGPLDAALLGALALMQLLRRRGMRPLSAIALASIAFSPAAGAAGKIDPTFGTAGTFDYRAPDTAQFVEAMPSGHVLVVSTNGDNCCTDSDVVVRRLDPEGRLDTTFGSTGKVELPIGFAAGATGLDLNRRLIIGGGLDAGGGFVAAVTPDGRLDSSFGDAGIRRLPDGVTALAVQPDGQVVVATAGSFVQDSSGQAVCSGEGWFIRRLSAQGADDPTFGNSGTVTSTQAEGSGWRNCRAGFMWTQPDGRIVVGSEKRTLRLEPNGSPDATFGAGREVPPPEGQVTRNPDGSFAYVLTDTDWLIGSAMLVRFDRNGVRLGTEVNLKLSLILTGSTAFQDRTGGARPVVAGDGAHYYVAFSAVQRELSGPFAGEDTLLGNFIARTNPDGSLDESFGEAGFARLGNDWVYQLVPLTGGRSLVLAGNRIFRLTGADQPSPGRVQVSPAFPSANESEGTVRIVLGRMLGSDGTLRASYSTSSATAIEGVDFVRSTGTLEWTPGDSTERTIEIPIIDDSVTESWETFTLELQSTVGPDSATIRTVRITIDDNDVAPPATPPAPAAPTPSPSSASGHGGGGRLGLAESALLAGLLAAMAIRGAATSRRRLPPRSASAAARPSGTSR